MQLILASSSPYRQRLLARLGLPFDAIAPDIDESPRPGEAPAALAERLALEKARAVSTAYPTALVIGSDQVASQDGVVRGKPGNLETAAAQLRASSGRTVSFFTGVALVRGAPALAGAHVEIFHAHFRDLAARDIDAYLEREPALDCAGSFKVEGLGIALFERLEGDDPTSLEGLPLIALCRLLREAGLEVIKYN